jgi:hypothetical protein
LKKRAQETQFVSGKAAHCARYSVFGYMAVLFIAMLLLLTLSWGMSLRNQSNADRSAGSPAQLVRTERTLTSGIGTEKAFSVRLRGCS